MNDSFVVTEVYITGVTRKEGKNGPYAMYETASSGTLVCFAGDLLAKIVPSDAVLYHLSLAEPKSGFKYKAVKALIKTENKPRVVQPAPAPVLRPAYGVASSGGSYVDKSSVFEEKDRRISRLSIFSSLVNLAAAKAGSDPDFAKRSFDDILLDIVSKSDMVTREFIYNANAPEVTSTIPAETHVVSVPPTTVSMPAQQGGTTAAVNYSVPPSQTVAASPQVVAKAVSIPPTPTPAPVVPPTPYQAPVQPAAPAPTEAEKQAAAGSLFGSMNQPDLEQRMAARLKELTSKARK